MANTYITPLPVQVGTGETTIYTCPGATSADVVVVFANATTAARTLNVFQYTGAGPGGDANRAWAEDFSLAAGQTLEFGPRKLTASYKITAICDSANGITAIPMGIETT